MCSLIGSLTNDSPSSDSVGPAGSLELVVGGVRRVVRDGALRREDPALPGDECVLPVMAFKATDGDVELATLENMVAFRIPTRPRAPSGFVRVGNPRYQP